MNGLIEDKHIEDNDTENIEYFKTKIANIKIEIECNFRYVFRQCKDYLAQFNTADFVVSVNEDDLEYERTLLKIPNIDIPYKGIAAGIRADVLESLAIYRKISEKLIFYDTFQMHGSVVALDGNAYMFTAPSGVGKTTRTKIWVDEYPDSIVVNGDKPLIRVTNDTVYACGTPWCGKEGWNTNTIVPLRAIFLLERADEGEDSYVNEVNLAKAFPILLEQSFRPSTKSAMRKTIQLLKALDGKVKFYIFHSTPTGDSVRLAYNTANPSIE